MRLANDWTEATPPDAGPDDQSRLGPLRALARYLPARSPYLKPWTMKGTDSRNKRGTRGAQVRGSVGFVDTPPAWIGFFIVGLAFIVMLVARLWTEASKLDDEDDDWRG